MHQLMKLIHADVAWWCRYGRFGETPVILDALVCSTHESVETPASEAFVGVHLGKGSFADRSTGIMEVRRGRWSLTAPSPVHLNKFALWEEEFTAPYISLRERTLFRERRWVHEFYERHEVCDQLRGFFYDHTGGALGTVSFWRCGTGPGFDERDKRTLNAELDITSALFPELTPSGMVASGYFILESDDEVNWMSPGLDEWLTDERSDSVLAEARKRDPKGFVLDDCIVEHTCLLDGQVLCRVTPTRPIGLSPLSGSTLQQRDVASLLCSGASNAEIAELLSLAPGAVRSCVQRLRTLFEVDSRFDLIVALNEHGDD